MPTLDQSLQRCSSIREHAYRANVAIITPQLEKDISEARSNQNALDKRTDLDDLARMAAQTPIADTLACAEHTLASAKWGIYFSQWAPQLPAIDQFNP